ncbi:hypothetical protein A3A68_01060 [Candidatus Saccharibacteria bacterium RIFCSPLOWO2_01_FULL_48_13]|nr:MAG: hypothetical protein A2884_01190 [Candidatus Saccharibacteria bacterium RIFCSPHIGHO2_01_FULL_48_12]OGL35455.1 MAG: hypothetical protein A3F38_02685 [Candidatus Saccharibacteria bacterium RIFCSPHIGHO2_12_FULL_48_21]OGL37028.1 MAG: hypothetical protein A3A68_01060 [Candidatus Saccharibacteria bacterium RIFCSPLOWO2_01_FULL_48_13]
MKVTSQGSDNINLDLTKDEILLFNNSVNEILNGPSAIDDKEFHARIGLNRDEAEKILKQVGELIESLRTTS